MLKTKKIAWRVLFWVILAAYVLYAAVFIYKTSFVIEGVRYFSLFDDSMISMRYARNLAQGNGLVWNANERVEGYTNPLWVGFMAIFHLLPIPISKISLCIQISGAIFVLLSLFYVRKIAEKITNANQPVSLLAVFLTAFYYPINTWSLLGTEVSVLLLVTTFAVWQAMRVFSTGKFSVWLYVVLGISTLVRIDMAVPYAIILLCMLLFDGQPASWRKHLLWGGGLLVVFLAGQTLFRVLYYGDIFPATYYLKMTGVPLLLRLKRGAYVFFKFAWNFNWALFLLPLAVLLSRPLRVFDNNKKFLRVVDRDVILCLAVIAGQVAYSLYVGGDAWEHRGGANRFITLGMPLFFVLFCEGVRLIFDRLRSPEEAEEPTSPPGRILRIYHWIGGSLRPAGMTAFVLFSLVNFNMVLDYNSLKEVFLLQPNVYVSGTQRYVKDAVLLNQITTSEARVAVVAAGNIPYFSPRYAIDLLGKNDYQLAKEPAHMMYLDDLTFFQPGHMKWDYAYSIGQLKPDVVVELRKDTAPDGEQYLGGYEKVKLNGHFMYLLKDSKSILWEQVTKNVQP